jgi:hypothetical protein
MELQTPNNERVLYYNETTKAIIMPNELGVMDKPAPVGDGWFWIKWPVNPHFTGETGILSILEHNYGNSVFHRLRSAK